MQKFDLLIIGSGPAGQKAAIQASKLGKNAAIVERSSSVGGVSVHTGTIPSKTLREAVLYLTGWRQRGFYGRAYRLKEKVSAADIMQRVDMTLGHEVEVMQHQLTRNNVTVINGTASFLDANRIRVVDSEDNDTEYYGEKILIATGTRPYRPNHIPFDGEKVLDSDDILNIDKIPRSMTIVGSGVIGIEYATIFSALDTEITLTDNRATILDFVDRELVDEMLHHLRDRGMTLRLDEEVTKVSFDNRKRVITHLKSGKRICSESILFAAGRVGATDQLGLEKADLQTDSRGRLKVNEQYQTSVPHIYAAGDVIGFPSLAATSMEQGRLAACHAFNHETHSHPENFPYGIYAVPEISMVGMTEQQLQKEGIAYESGIARFREIARGQILGIQEGVLKMLFSIKDRKLLGVHIVGEGATELVHIGQAVLALEGTLDYFLENAFNYPTLAEAYKVAALNAWNRMSAYGHTKNSRNSKPPIKAVK